MTQLIILCPSMNIRRSLLKSWFTVKYTALWPGPSGVTGSVYNVQKVKIEFVSRALCGLFSGVYCLQSRVQKHSQSEFWTKNTLRNSLGPERIQRVNYSLKAAVALILFRWNLFMGRLSEGSRGMNSGPHSPCTCSWEVPSRKPQEKGMGNLPWA